ncbi:unnamed protein product [Darwinula stevensoni]|uniref:CUB domain-containing protein n=1 Tax=Darwinula stevensoni TaxID=69355 RepID=A0A7R9A3X1_9CRUS|nr:unnamed protein product [Darwinula stevensoni]CAG0891432.1 unnamed protein product [Darwinula stevensoni]
MRKRRKQGDILRKDGSVGTSGRGEDMAEDGQWRVEGTVLKCISFALVLSLSPVGSSIYGCDRVLRSGEMGTGEENGTVEGPSLLNPDLHAQHCIYTFVAGMNGRVQITFEAFNLRGQPPECTGEYIDLFAEVEDSYGTALAKGKGKVKGKGDGRDLIHSPLGGRYCGVIPPRTRISLYRPLVLAFFTTKNVTSPDIFRVRYQFINGSTYELGGRLPGRVCSFVLRANTQRSGKLLSPTYPGAYPKGLNCSYRFQGDKDQRIRLEFRDFDLFYGGPHCPFDYVRVYDGLETSAPLVGTYCGQRRNLVIYSSTENLLITLTTMERMADAQNRGFSGLYEFSEVIARLDFITQSGGEHIRGTQCDQKVLSGKETNGSVVSPNWPLPYMTNIICRYFIYGMQDSQNLERVRLEFKDFWMPDTDGKCSETSLKVYMRGQEETMEYDKPDHVLCGEKRPAGIVSEGPRMLLIFSSGQGKGFFKAAYRFETEYQIPGTAAPDGSCRFTYRSTSAMQGDFNSPRHPTNYPPNLLCTYLFLPGKDEQVRLIFDIFVVDPIITAFGKECRNDWLEVWNVYQDNTTRLVGRWCGKRAPGPIQSNVGAVALKVILNTDGDGVSSGFKARYVFEKLKPLFKDCGGNLSKVESGVITSPGWPGQYNAVAQTCTWYIHARPGHRLLLHFTTFHVEGDPQSRGCPGATVRVWESPSADPAEDCGENSTGLQFVSEANTLRLMFITADKAVGAQGFQAIWTEIKDDPHCDGFHCSKNGYCISDNLRCNGYENCGVGDKTDELNCVERREVNVLLLVGVGVGILGVLMLGVCICCHRKRKRRRGLGRGRRPDTLPIAASAVSPHRMRNICDHHSSSLTGLRYASQASNIDPV